MGGATYPNKKGEHLAKPIMIRNIYRLPWELVKN